MNEETIKLPAIIIDALHAKGYTVERLSELSGVSETFLTSLIEGEVIKLPSRPYTHGYLIKIAETLNLDGEKLWKEYLKDNDAIRRSGKNDQLPQNRFAIKGLNKKTITIGLVGLIIIVYLGFQIPGFFGQPKLNLENLNQEITISQDKIFKIIGEIEPKSQLTINGERIYPNKEGGFEKNINLTSGFNTITFTTKKLLGKEYVFKKLIDYQEPENNNLENVEDLN